MIRLYLAIGAFAVLGALAWHYNHLIDSNKQLRTDLSARTAELEQSQALIIKERQIAAEVGLRAQKFYEQRSKDDEELEKLRTCYADKSCWPRVRVKTYCPAVSGASADSGTPQEASAELGEDAGRNLLLLRSQIKEVTTTYKALQDELAARSTPDYCQPK
jgi:hypothetical protein